MHLPLIEAILLDRRLSKEVAEDDPAGLLRPSRGEPRQPHGAAPPTDSSASRSGPYPDLVLLDGDTFLMCITDPDRNRPEGGASSAGNLGFRCAATGSAGCNDHARLQVSVLLEHRPVHRWSTP
ncbi:hypothetical protein [Micromonospora sp. CPCC 206061]|uniref:hypothetical protein n=1 Tax=Micromonospora sp. CPCC 206061 TaxID=3122410 RepID=UPI002FEF4B79